MKSRHPAGRQVPGRHAPDPSRAGKPAVSPESAAVGATSRPPRPSTEMSSRMKQTPDSALGSLPSHPRGPLRTGPAAVWLLLLGLLTTAGCSNNPYPRDEADRPIVYRALSDDPKTLDPSVCYIVDAGEILSLICNSYFQYDYLKQNPLKLE